MQLLARRLLFALTLISGLAFAQQKTISGYIRDAENGEELIGASVLINDLKQGSVTNVYGFYSITIPEGMHELEFSYIGYETKKQNIDLKDNMQINIDLKASAEMIGEVTLTDKKQDQNIRQVEMSVAKLDAKTVKKVPAVLGEVDIIKSIQLLPGVTSAREGANGFNVRGGSVDQNLILLDESTIYNSSHLFGFFSVFNADAVKNMKLYKGGIPAQYGGRLSSVLDVRQREGNTKEFHGSGGIGLISSRLLLEGPIAKDKSSFMIAGRRSYADLFLKLSPDENLRDNSAYFYDLNLKANYILNNNNRFFLSGYLGRDAFAFGDLFQSSWGNSNINLRWNHVFNDRLFSNLTAIYSIYDYNINIKPPGSEFQWTSNIINNNLKYDLTYYLNKNNTMRFGGELINYSFEPGIIEPIEGSDVQSLRLDDKFALEPAIYFSNEQTVSERLSVQYGIRASAFYRMGKQVVPVYENDAPVVFDHNQNQYINGTEIGEEEYGSGDVIESFMGLEPRLAVRYALDDENAIKASYNRTRQNIHLITNASSPSPLDIWAPSGSFIDPQIADQYAIGYFKNFQDNTYEASVELYYKDMQNQLDYVDFADLEINNNIETELLQGDGRAYGLELLVRKNKGRFTGWISYTLARTERKIEGLGVGDPGINNGDWYVAPYDKTHDLSITGMYEFNKKWSFSANFILASGIPTNYPKAAYDYGGFIAPFYDGTRNQERLPLYHRLDIGATMQGKKTDKWETEWIFSVYNLYNRQNASSIFFRQNEDTNRTEAVQLTIFGIVPSVTWNFKF